MFNKQLETNINNERILDKLAENLGLDFITDGSNIKKIADTYTNEHVQFANAVDQTISSGFINSMPTEYLDLFGRQYNLQRKRYNNLVLPSYLETVSVKINKEQALVTSLSVGLLILKANTIIYSDDSITIESLENVYISDINEVVDISVKISLNLGLDSFVIKEGSSYSIPSNNSEIQSILPHLELSFNRSVGLAILEELESDYKARIFEATYIANNGANSLIASIAKEVPLVTTLEVDDYVKGKAMTYIYPYTDTLIVAGVDNVLETFVIPMIESSLNNKVMYGQIIKVLAPSPIINNVYIKYTGTVKPSESFLDNICLSVNNYFYTTKTIDKVTLFNYINSNLTTYGFKFEDFRFEFISPYVSEEVFNLSSLVNEITIPKGRFFYLNSITIEEI